MRRDSQRANGGRCRNACRWRVEEEEEGLRLLARNASWCRSVGAASVRRRDAVVMVRQLLSEGQLSVMKSVCHCCCWSHGLLSDLPRVDSATLPVDGGSGRAVTLAWHSKKAQSRRVSGPWITQFRDLHKIGHHAPVGNPYPP